MNFKKKKKEKANPQDGRNSCESASPGVAHRWG